MPKSAQQILNEYRGISYEDTARRDGIFSGISSSLKSMTDQINDSIDLGLEEENDLFLEAGISGEYFDDFTQELKADINKLAGFADALSTVNQLNTGEYLPDEKKLDDAIKVLADTKDIGEILSKTIDEGTAAFYNMPDLAGKTYLEAIPVLSKSAGQEMSQEQFKDSLAFVNNYLELGLDLSPVGIQSMSPEQKEAEDRIDPDMFGTDLRKYGVEATPVTVQQADGNLHADMRDPDLPGSGPAGDQSSLADGQGPQAGGAGEIDVNAVRKDILDTVKPAPHLEELYLDLVNSVTGIAKMPGNEGAIVELRDELRQNGFTKAGDANALVSRVKNAITNKYGQFASDMRGSIDSLDRVSSALNEYTNYERHNLHEDGNKLQELTSMFSTRTSRLYINSSEYKQAKADLDRYLTARMVLEANYAEAVNIARTGGSQLNMNRTMQKRPGLEKEAADAEKALRQSMTKYVNKVSKNGTKTIDQMSHGYGAARLTAGNGVLEFLDKYGLGSAAQPYNTQKASPVYKDNNEKIRETSFAKLYAEQRTKNESGTDRKKKAADAALKQTQKNEKEKAKKSRSAMMQ